MSVLGGALVTLSTASLKHLYSQLLYKEVLCYYCFFIKGNTGDHAPCSMLTLLKSRELDRWAAAHNLGPNNTMFHLISLAKSKLFYSTPIPRFHASLFWHLYTLLATFELWAIVDLSDRVKKERVKPRQPWTRRGAAMRLWRQWGDKHAVYANKAISQCLHFYFSWWTVIRAYDK